MTINGYKLKQDDNFRQTLMATGDDYLLHFSKSDKKWGGLIPKTLERNVENVKGENALGIMLMELRKEANLHTRIN